MQQIRGELELRLMVLRCSAVCTTDSMSLTSLAHFDGSAAAVMKVLASVIPNIPKSEKTNLLGEFKRQYPSVLFYFRLLIRLNTFLFSTSTLI